MYRSRRASLSFSISSHRSSLLDTGILTVSQTCQGNSRLGALMYQSNNVLIAVHGHSRYRSYKVYSSRPPHWFSLTPIIVMRRTLLSLLLLALDFTVAQQFPSISAQWRVRKRTFPSIFTLLFLAKHLVETKHDTLYPTKDAARLGHTANNNATLQ